MTCLTGRLGWLPLASSVDLRSSNKGEGQKLHFDDLSFSLACGRFTMAFEFSQSTWAKLLGALSKVQDQANNISVAFGPSISLLNMHDILTFHKRFSKLQISMQSGTEPVPWTRILQNSGLSPQSGNISMSQKQSAYAQGLLEEFILNHNCDAVHALLEAGVCSTTGLTSRGLMYLTFAVEMKPGIACGSKIKTRSARPKRQEPAANACKLEASLEAKEKRKHLQAAADLQSSFDLIGVVFRDHGPVG